MGESSTSSESFGESSSRGVSPSRSDESMGRSVSPPTPAAPVFVVPPPRKKRQAPKPPQFDNAVSYYQDD